ncbi:fungal specific transcription factor [Colletotrichum tabaci]|uniref:Fungal specific transcription factor n=1 Tax=Colletotrichum tabaci TaxID=1209068 RepID=A0AAV9T9T4_9PEZI
MDGPTVKRPPADWDRGGVCQIKCDHRKPVCSGCEKYADELYQHVVDRLAQMEQLPSPGSKPYYSGAESEATVGTVGSCSLFSAEGITKIDALVGDNRFSVAVQGLLQRIRRIAPPPNPDPLASSVTYPFPPNNVIMECMTDFFQTLNHDIKLLDEAEVRAAVQSYIYGRPPPGSGWRMALNVILLHALRKRDWASPTGEYDKYLHNAMCLIPSAILQTPNPMAIGALLSLSSYFIFKAENHTSLSVLAVAVQHILLAGYHHANHPALPAADVLHRRRLFWQAYVLDHDLMLRIGKPPLIADDFLLALPDEFPADGYGVFFYPGDVTLNYFRQQVRLSRIQGRICSRLYFKQHTPSSSWLEAEIAALDAELHEWRESIPAMIRPQPPSSGLVDADYSRMMSLSLVVAVHSAAFRTRALDGGDDGDAESLRPSIAVCVNAARGAISLLNYHQLQHPFTIYLLYQVAWCVDILFVNILEHKTSPQSLQDLDLIRLVLSFFERYDADHLRVASYHIIRALYDVASSVTANATPLPALPPMIDALADSMPMLSMSASASASDLDMAGWEEVSLGGHDWLSAGFLQMADWGLPDDDAAAAAAGTDEDLDYI